MKPESIYKVCWTSPSNIALVKYWGKYGNQMPQNPSISFTLKHSHTTLSLEVHKSTSAGLAFYFEGIKNAKFEDKINKFLKTQIERFPWIANHHLEIHSKNTFPHSSGIASSASSMSALCLCLMSVDEYINDIKFNEADFFKEVSFLSRLASGSASRSVYPKLVSWGESRAIEGSSNLFASPFINAHPIFNDFCDSILIVDDKEKSVSSRAGHSLMENHPYKEARFNQARENIEQLLASLKSGDLNSFIKIVEEDALSLHALMMTSRPSYILLKPESLWLIEQVKMFREKENIPVCFTIDAGPNLHLLYPRKFESVIRPWIENDLSSKLVGIKWIHDEVGLGPCKVENV